MISHPMIRQGGVRLLSVFASFSVLLPATHLALANPINGDLEVTGDLELGGSIIHLADTDTFLKFESGGDEILSEAGGIQFFRLQETSSQDYFVINDDGVDLDFRIESDNYSGAFFVQGDTGNIGIGTTSPSFGDISYGGASPAFHLKRSGVSGSFMPIARFQAGPDSDQSGAAIVINQGNDRGLIIEAGRGTGNQAVAHFGLANYNGDVSRFMSAIQGGKVGIGTIEPKEQLHVQPSTPGDVSMRLSINDSTAGAEASIDFHMTSNQDTMKGARIVAERIGSNAKTDLKFYAGSGSGGGTLLEVMRLTDGGYVGIGTDNPSEKLDVRGNASIGIGATGATIEFNASDRGMIDVDGTRVLDLYSDGNLRIAGSLIAESFEDSSGNQILSAASGNTNFHSSVQFFDTLEVDDSFYTAQGMLLVHPVDSGSEGGKLHLIAADGVTQASQTIDNHGGNLRVSMHHPQNGTIEALRINDSGSLSLGTTNADYKLNVAGVIRAEEVIVETGWADYVFEEGYALPSLQEVETHIAENGHLPGIPSAAEVQRQGLSVGDSQRLMMQKIEELTLYLIQERKDKAALEARLLALEALLGE